MGEFIRASVSTVESLFLQAREFRLPWFQRAYAWREENALRLVSDVADAMDRPTARYSLGHIHLAGKPDVPSVALIDGHQRAITLALIFAILRDMTAADTSLSQSERSRVHNRLHSLIERAADPGAATAGWCLAPQPQMSAFFETYAQRAGATLLEPLLPLAEMTPAERNLLANRDRLRTFFDPIHMPAAKRSRFIEFLLTGCHLVVIEVDDEDEAWSMLGIQQSTRLPHDASEQSKITLIYAMPSADQEPAGRLWENAQAQIGNERMTELLGHLRMARLKRRSVKPLELELQCLYKIDADGLGFMNGALLPYAQALARIDSKQIGTGTAASFIARHVDTLSWLDHRHWVAPALVWLTTKSDQHPETEQFFAALDRYAWLHRLAGTDPNEFENLFIRLTGVVGRSAPVSTWPELQIEKRTAKDALTVLRSRTFYYKHMCHRVLRRLCHQLGSDPGSIDGVRVSVEHILPRRPAAGRQWLKDFNSEAGIAEHTDRLGNLALLTGPQNRKADTNDWIVKRDILKSSGFGLSDEACQYAKWNPKTIDVRTEKLIKLLFDHWQVPVTNA